MSIEKINESMEELYNTKGIEACILYRIDGSPIFIKAPDQKNELITIMNWMEKQIKFVIQEIKEKNLENLKFALKQRKIFFHPSSRPTVIATIISKDSHQKLISIEINRAKKKIKNNMT